MKSYKNIYKYNIQLYLFCKYLIYLFESLLKLIFQLFTAIIKSFILLSSSQTLLFTVCYYYMTTIYTLFPNIPVFYNVLEKQWEYTK